MRKIIFCLLMLPTSLLMLSALSANSQTTTTDDFRLAVVCNSCHGEKGLASGAYIPTIKGQSKDYLVNVMNGLKDGSRHATLMQPLLKGYSEDKIAGVAMWFDKMNWEKSTQKIDMKKAELGKKLAEDCMGCHNNEAASYVPKINGQQAKYLNNAMLEYKNKMRGESDTVIEMSIVIDMKNEELEALAEYFGSLK